MNYGHNYYKLSNCVYTTIRKSKKPNQKIGFIDSEYLTEYFQKHLIHHAVILRIDRVILDDLPESILIMDCLFPNSNINSRLKCYELFQSFYMNKIDFSKQKFYLFLLMKIKPIKIDSFLYNTFRKMREIERFTKPVKNKSRMRKLEMVFKL